MVKPPPSVLWPTTPLTPPTTGTGKDEPVGIGQFPGSREYMGTIQTASGREYKVYMPIVYDYASTDMSQPEGSYRLGAKSIGISYLEFQTWSFPDAQLVMSKLSDAISILYFGDKR